MSRTGTAEEQGTNISLVSGRVPSCGLLDFTFLPSCKRMQTRLECSFCSGQQSLLQETVSLGKGEWSFGRQTLLMESRTELSLLNQDRLFISWGANRQAIHSGQSKHSAKKMPSHK